MKGDNTTFMCFIYDVLSYSPLVNMFFAKICFGTHTFCVFGQYVFDGPRIESIILLFGHAKTFFGRDTNYVFWDQACWSKHSICFLGFTHFVTKKHFLNYDTNVFV